MAHIAGLLLDSPNQKSLGSSLRDTGGKTCEAPGWLRFSSSILKSSDLKYFSVLVLINQSASSPEEYQEEEEATDTDISGVLKISAKMLL